MLKAAFHTLGCKVNSYETEAMQELLEKAGYEIVPFEDKADVYIINTCSVTNVADKKSRQMLHRAKKKNPDSVVVATGCYVQAAGAKLLTDSAVDIIIGNDRRKTIADVLSRYFAGENETGEVIDIAHSGAYEELHVEKVSDHTRAFIKIQDGCNQFCSYCIIPYTRGRVRSRKPEDVYAEALGLAESGYKEIVITGIHISSYGTDFPGNAGYEMQDTNYELLDLLEKLDAIPGIERLRLGSLEPRIVTEEFTERIAKLKTICPHFHLSLQSGCNDTLKRMNRHYTAEDYKSRCDILRKYFDNPAITTDVIVGFPGETLEEFAVTKDFLADISFYEMHIFKYSRREGTRADKMPDQIPESMKDERSHVLSELEKELSVRYRESFLGKENELLIEEEVEINGGRYMIGHTREYVKGAVLYDPSLKNTTVKGVFTEMLSDEVLLLKQLA